MISFTPLVSLPTYVNIDFHSKEVSGPCLLLGDRVSSCYAPPTNVSFHFLRKNGYCHRGSKLMILSPNVPKYPSSLVFRCIILITSRNQAQITIYIISTTSPNFKVGIIQSGLKTVVNILNTYTHSISPVNGKSLLRCVQSEVTSLERF